MVMTDEDTDEQVLQVIAKKMQRDRMHMNGFLAVQQVVFGNFTNCLQRPYPSLCHRNGIL